MTFRRRSVASCGGRRQRHDAHGPGADRIPHHHTTRRSWSSRLHGDVHLAARPGAVRLGAGAAAGSPRVPRPEAHSPTNAGALREPSLRLIFLPRLHQIPSYGVLVGAPSQRAVNVVGSPLSGLGPRVRAPGLCCPTRWRRRVRARAPTSGPGATSRLASLGADWADCQRVRVRRVTSSLKVLGVRR